MRVCEITAGLVTGVVALPETYVIAPDRRSASGRASYEVQGAHGSETVEYDAVFEASHGTILVASEEAAPGWTWSDLAGFLPPAAPPPPVDAAAYRIAIQSLIDGAAQARGYDSGLTCASYLGSTVTLWAAEARALVDWRDAVWSHALAELARVEAGERPQPGVDDLLAELPPLAWPDG